jgi:ribulose-phosphate 3-epimerase
MKGFLSPSMMCADISALKTTLEIFERNGVEYLHIDVMDGSFVPNFTLGTDYVKQLRGLTRIPLDIHLMIREPEAKIDWFDPRPGEFVGVHPESTAHFQRALQNIRARGAKAMAVLNPATPLDALEYVWDDLDGVLIMTVNPGFAGQKLIPATLRKIRECREAAERHGHPDILIEADGNVSLENAVKMAERGADMFVLGTSCLFTPDRDLDSAIKRFRRAIAPCGDKR